MGRHLSEETKEKIGIANTGKTRSEEIREKISENNAKYWLGKNPWENREHPRGMLGKEHSEETKQKMRLAHIGKPFSNEHKQKLRLFHIGKPFSDERKEKMRIAQNRPEVRMKKSLSSKITHNTPEVRERKIRSLRATLCSLESKRKRSQQQKKLWENKEYKEKQKILMSIGQSVAQNRPEVSEKKSRKLKITLSDPIIKEGMSQRQKNLWRNQEYREKQMLAIGKGLRLFPNKPETFILGLLNEMYPNEWKYTGDFSFIIDGKSPDFTNINGQKKVVELFGDYWHKGQNPQDRIDIFKQFGFDTLVIWEHELKDVEMVKMKINNFYLGLEL